MIICTPASPPEPATGQVSEAEGDPVRAMYTLAAGEAVHMMGQTPLATVVMDQQVVSRSL